MGKTMEIDLKVRCFQESDFESLLNIDGKPSGRRKHKLQLVAKMGNVHCLVAECRGKPIGFVMYEDLGDNSYYLIQINAEPRRQKIGSFLMTNLFKEIKESHLSLCVNCINHSAISFYEKLGFVWAGFTRNYRDGQDKFWYTKKC